MHRNVGGSQCAESQFAMWCESDGLGRSIDFHQSKL